MKAKWVVVVCLVLLALPGCSNGPRPPGGISVKLEMAKAPRLNEPVEVTLTVEAEEDAPGTEVGLQLAPTVIVVDGEGKWRADLKANRPATFSTTIKFTNEGYFDVRAFALCQREGQPTLGGESKTVYLHVTKEEGSFGIPTADAIQPAEQMAPSLVPSPDTLSTPMPDPLGEKAIPPSPLPLEATLETTSQPRTEKVVTYQVKSTDDDVPITDDGEWVQTGMDIQKGVIPGDVVVSKVEVMRPVVPLTSNAPLLTQAVGLLLLNIALLR